MNVSATISDKQNPLFHGGFVAHVVGRSSDFDETSLLVKLQTIYESGSNLVYKGKSTFDQVVALAMICILFVPVFIPIGLLICFTSKGGAIYRQVRIGKDCKPFQIIKFRSMVKGADIHGYQTDTGDSRITSVGKVIRLTSLDELPQLFNVLKGEMSLVGPRPDTPMQKKDYTEEAWSLRHTVKPGITGLAQVSGRSNMGYEERLAYDLEYVRTASFTLDIKILLKTFRAMMGNGVN